MLLPSSLAHFRIVAECRLINRPPFVEGSGGPKGRGGRSGRAGGRKLVPSGREAVGLRPARQNLKGLYRIQPGSQSGGLSGTSLSQAVPLKAPPPVGTAAGRKARSQDRGGDEEPPTPRAGGGSAFGHTPGWVAVALGCLLYDEPGTRPRVSFPGREPYCISMAP